MIRRERVLRVRRPAGGAGDTRSPEFDLAYVRTGPNGVAGVQPGAVAAITTPVVVIPGGPGLASIAPYRSFRRMAAHGGLDVIMVEHRGVGRSRTDRQGRPLPHSAMWVHEVVDDLAAVLDREGIDKTVVVGSSYGSYLASAFGVRHPARVAAMVLDSALQSTGDLELERAVIRERFWSADTDLARTVRRLADGGVDQRVLLDVVRASYELGGERLALAVARARIRHTRSVAWAALERYALRDESIVHIPGRYEFDIAGAIGFRELDYAPAPDGEPLDPALTYAPLADRFPRFVGERFDLPAATPAFPWPMVLLAGTRDVRTPPAIAQRVARTARDGVLVEIDNGHSALDTHPAALLNVIRATASGNHARLARLAPRLDRLPRVGAAARLPHLIAALAGLERGPRD